MTPIDTNMKAIREQVTPVSRHPLPNRETLLAIEEARNGIGLSRGFSSVEGLMEDLNADD